MKQLADTFWNIRGVFRVVGINIGTHMSVVRRGNGRFVIIDGCDLDDAQRQQLMALTGNGEKVDAVVHVHPFHTMYVEAMHALFPAAALYGTARHREKAPALPWSQTPVETWGDDHPLADLLNLSVPEGVDFVCADERVHVASVLVRHRQSGIVHVDDTFNVMAASGTLGKILPQSSLRMHPMLSRALTQSAGAADAYAGWARWLASAWSKTSIVCAAHSAVRELPAGGFKKEVEDALAKVADVLDRHRKRFG
ncbi:hypothetical protein GCM10011521_09820 [Arenimonas soli]|uniref:MBL fold metallo-hydrolase n=1 Tax=Arenimonas soli TaxID=2269504 RepID=A0ABQ1HEB5_9GAMM|nr:MBL fold metallo-hydrolase [Arenimonas soli]GGA73722.1 hypothetical protein GCM10011521_09820 [Arenimonas soli]